MTKYYAVQHKPDDIFLIEEKEGHRKMIARASNTVELLAALAKELGVVIEIAEYPGDFIAQTFLHQSIPIKYEQPHDTSKVLANPSHRVRSR